MVLDRVNAGNRGIGNQTNAGVGFHSKRIQAGLSTQIVIQVEDPVGTKFVVGAVQSLTYNQNRSLARVKEVGTDGTIGIVPNAATEYDIQLGRIVFDFQRLPQALQREYRHIHAQRRPFDLVITDYNPYLLNGATSVTDTGAVDPGTGGGERTVDNTTGSVTTSATDVVETVFQNCWFNSMNFTYDASDYLITEQATMWCEHVFDRAAATVQSTTKDALERNTNTSSNASILSAFDATRVD